jgi:hypothetical protein
LFLNNSDKAKMLILERKNKIINQRLGLETILKQSLQLDYLKELLMDEKQLYLFNNSPKRTLNYHEHQENENQYYSEKYKEILKIVGVENQELSKNLMKILE